LKRKIAWIAGFLALIATIIALSRFPLNNSHTVVSSRHQHGVHTLHARSACQLLPAATTEKILRAPVRSVDVPAASQTSTEDVRVSSCAYETDAASAVSLTARAALHRSAYATNRLGFESTLASAKEQGHDTSTTVSVNYHVAAYYNPAFKQLHILIRHGQYWLIVQADAGKAKTEQLAQSILSQLSY
jgi:cytochrome c1